MYITRIELATPAFCPLGVSMHIEFAPRMVAHIKAVNGPIIIGAAVKIKGEWGIEYMDSEGFHQRVVPNAFKATA